MEVNKLSRLKRIKVFENKTRSLKINLKRSLVVYRWHEAAVSKSFQRTLPYGNYNLQAEIREPWVIHITEFDSLQTIISFRMNLETISPLRVAITSSPAPGYCKLWSGHLFLSSKSCARDKSYDNLRFLNTSILHYQFINEMLF